VEPSWAGARRVGQSRALAVAVAVASLALGVAGCGAADENDGAAGEYPLVTAEEPERITVTDMGGGVVERPAKPTAYEVEPSPTCERRPYVDHATGKQGTAVFPPAPGLVATAVSEREVDVSWSFTDLPADCRPIGVLVSVTASDAQSPTNEEAWVVDKDGTERVTYPDFLPPPDVAMASAYTLDRRRSRVVRVLIRR
jgi:hypothetical protein